MVSATDIPATMRALWQPSLSGPRHMRLIADAPVPEPGLGEVLIKVTAAGVNFADVMRSNGTYGGGPVAPYLPGLEAVGQIVRLGAEVTALERGNRVVGAGYGAFAEYMVLRAAGVAPVPAGWTDEQALGLIMNWVTALAALKTLGRIAAGEVVLIHAAAGGVGQAAVRLAKHFGATVIASASAGKHDAVRALGADHVLDHGSADLAAEVLRQTDGRGADLVLESVGGESFRASVTAAKRVTGRVVVYGVAGGEATISNWELNFRHQIHVIGLHIGVLIEHSPQIFAELMTELSALIAAGVLPPGQPSVHDLADGPRVLAELEARATIGKLALRP
ncbi:zinc-binding dehydrogenase [Lysobacter korlensis]|uniref:Zinc-binding dehydrogenase n=1 Tax=Lysobacter korlensis TaxID=553636 RepID=A0ABV6RWB7_9GAMM